MSPGDVLVSWSEGKIRAVSIVALFMQGFRAITNPFRMIEIQRRLRLFSTSPLSDLLRSNLNEDIFNYIVTLIAGLEYLSGSDLIKDTRRSMLY